MQMILVMDHAVLPEHLKQTFMLYEVQGGWASRLSVDVAVEGQNIDLDADGYVIVYAFNEWHINRALELKNQIKQLRTGAQVLMLPVSTEVTEPPKTEETFSFSFIPIP